MGFLTTWAVDGSRTPAAVARMQTYASLPHPGVILPEHCKLVVLSASTVGLTAGAVVISAGSSGAAQYQSYVAAVESTEGGATASVSMPVATSRTLEAVVVVPDPQWAGVPTPADPLTSVYAELRILTPAQLSALTTPHYHVATLVIPAGASVLTAAMITDRRSMSRPRSKSELRVLNIAPGSTSRLTNMAAYPAGQVWPQEATDTWGPFDIPEWATRVKIVMMWASVFVPAGQVAGHLWVQIGLTVNPDKVSTAAVAYDTLGLTNGSTMTLVAADEVRIPPALRGTPQRFYPFGRVHSKGSGSPELTVRNTTAVVMQVEFREFPD